MKHAIEHISAPGKPVAIDDLRNMILSAQSARGNYGAHCDFALVKSATFADFKAAIAACGFDGTRLVPYSATVNWDNMIEIKHEKRWRTVHDCGAVGGWAWY